MNEEPYLYNNKPLQLSYSNDYTPPGEKIEIVLQIQQDYESGMLSVSQMRWIVFNCRFGAVYCSTNNRQINV